MTSSEGTKKARTRLSYIIKDTSQDHIVPEGISLHRQGINTLVIDYDSYAKSGGGFLYSGARDSIINQWKLSLDPSSTLLCNHDPQFFNAADIQIPSSGGTLSKQNEYGLDAKNTNLATGPFANGATPDSAPLASLKSTAGSIKRLGHRDPAIAASLPSFTSNLPTSQPHPIQEQDVFRSSFNHTNPQAMPDSHKAKVTSHVSFSGNNQRAHQTIAASRKSGISTEGIHGMPYESMIQYNKSILSPSPSASISQSLLGHTDWVNDLALLDKGRHLISCSSDRTIVLWDTENLQAEPVKLGSHGGTFKFFNNYLFCL